LDVPNEIDDEGFWEEFRNVVKGENPDAYLLGEIWDGDPRWVGEKSFDGLMNYPIRDALINILTGSISVGEFSEIINRQLSQYSQDHVYAMYNPLGSHDTVRILTELEGDKGKLKMAYQFLLAYPGAPAIYYGDELGLEGGEDPECRKAFPWDEDQWDQELRKNIQSMIAVRKRHPVLRRGSYLEVFADENRNSYCFARKLGEESILVALNASGNPRNLRLSVNDLNWSDGRIVKDVFSQREFIVSGTELNLPLDPWQGYWII
jgi:glycosidase